MKLQYRRGDSFALPLGNGTFARSCIVECEHRVVVVRILVGNESSFDVRVSDEALVLHRWKRDGRIDLAAVPKPQPQNVYWMRAARAERMAAAARGTPHPRERKIAVREVRDDTAADAFASLDADCVVAFTERVSASTLDALSNAIRNHPGVMLRLHNTAVSLLPELTAAPIERLTLSGEAEPLPLMPSVRHLDLSEPYHLEAIVAAFPNLESLRLGARGAVVRMRTLAALGNLRALDLSTVHVSDPENVSQLARLDALKLNRVTGFRTMDTVGEMPLRTLAVEHLHELERLDGLARGASLEQLELAGLWQFDIQHLAWMLERERLVRVTVDIGGRRKNVELYRRAQWAYPWRFLG